MHVNVSKQRLPYGKLAAVTRPSWAPGGVDVEFGFGARVPARRIDTTAVTPTVTDDTAVRRMDRAQA
jgi:hypothetical protein